MRLLENGCKRFALCHISQENNTPEFALESVRATLLGAGVVPGQDCVRMQRAAARVSPIIGTSAPCGSRRITGGKHCVDHYAHRAGS